MTFPTTGQTSYGTVIKGYIDDADAAVTTGAVTAYGPKGTDTTSQVRAFVHRLSMAVEPTVFTAVGDSTGWMTRSWLNDFVQYNLAPAFPAVTFEQRTWDATNEKYPDVSTVLQTGTAGARRFVVTGASTDRYFSVADSAATSPGGSLDVRVKVNMPSLTSSAVTLAGKYDTGTNNRSWFVSLDSSNKLNLFFSTDGTSGTQVTRTSTVAVPGAAVATPIWLRVTWLGNDGSGNNVTNFYYSTDQSSWTQIGTTVTTATASATIFDSTTATQFPSRGAAGNTTGGAIEYYALQVFTSLTAGARPVIDIETSSWNGYGTNGTTATFTDFVGNTVLVNGTGQGGAMTGAPVCVFLNGCASGQAIAYANDSTRFPKLTPKPSDLFLINFSHNEVGTVDYRPAYKTLADAAIAKWPDVGIVAVVQNPRFSPASNITEHAIRGARIASLAAGQRYALVNAYKVLEDTGIASSYVRSDGIHPTIATDSFSTSVPGSDLIRAAAWGLFSVNLTS